MDHRLPSTLPSSPAAYRREAVAPVRLAFTLIELLVVIGIIVVLIAILLPMAEKVRESALKTNCASNLREIGQAIALYCNESRGEYPRTTYVPDAPLCFGTGAAAADPFQPGGPQANDVTAALFLLVRTQNAPAKIFVCPYGDVNKFEMDKTRDLAARSNFADYKRNLGYSYANPYPSSAAAALGYHLHNRMNPAFAVAADLNPGAGGDESRNHEDEGQNVLFADGHVQWQLETTCGVGADNIYRTKNKTVVDSPVNAEDSILLPAQN